MRKSDSSATMTSNTPRKKTATAEDLAAKMGQKNMLLALEKKKRCNARAQLLVEEFIDLVTDTERFLDKLQYISQSHYEDIVEERSIERNCGYPMCPALLENIPSKKYHICRASNTIYDITDRKKFCSTMCFRASNYIRAQLLTSPLWLRDAEPMPQFQLMPDWRAPLPVPAIDAEAPTLVEVLHATRQEADVTLTGKDDDDDDLCDGIEKLSV